MALTRVDTGLQSFPDFTRNQQLANAQIYIGVPGLDPAVLANQYQAFVVQENGTQVAVPQPIRTSAGGIPTYNGSPVQIAVAESAYSVKVLTSLGSQIYYQPDNTDLALINAAQSSYTPAGTGAATVTQQFWNDLYVNVKGYGAIPNVESMDASAANVIAFQSALNQAVIESKDVFIPTGIYWFVANNGLSTGITLNVPNGKSVKFIGEIGATIKRVAAPTMASTSSLVWMTANAGITIEWHGITFDGNEANCEYDAGNPFNEEQSGNIKWRSGTGTPKALRFFNCDVGKNRVGDGYHANIRVDHFMASNCSTIDTSVRRVRADWQFSRYATYDTVMTNIVCNSWESEPADTQQGARLLLSNVHSESTFDLAGDTTGVTSCPILAQLTNVTCMGVLGRSGLPFVNFFRVHGEAHNCNFRPIDRIQRCKIKFIGGSITVEDNGAGVADAVEIWHDQNSETFTSYTDRFGNYVIFDGVTFLKDSTVTTGEYILVATTATLAGQLGSEMVRLAVINCHTPEPIDRIMTSNRAGLVEIRKGVLRANDAIVTFGNDGSFYNKTIVEPTTLWSAPDLWKFTASINVTGSILETYGEWDGDVMDTLDSGAVSGAANVTWRSNAIMHLAASPAGSKSGFPGLRAKVRGRAIGIPNEYRFTGDDDYGQTTWAAIPSPPARNTTANRPALTASDSGQMYFDTTLDADGKPIWWTGTAWVDATGLVV